MHKLFLYYPKTVSTAFSFPQILALLHTLLLFLTTSERYHTINLQEVFGYKKMVHYHKPPT